MFNDDVSLDAGAIDTGYLDPAVMEHIVSDIGRTLRQRTTLYNLTLKHQKKDSEIFGGEALSGVIKVQRRSSACLPVMPFLIPRPNAERFASFTIPVRISSVSIIDGPIAGRTFAAG
jgi:hypothetical protein